MKVFIFIFFLSCNLYCNDWISLKYDPSKAAVDNPLKGFVPFSGQGLNNQFPFSMEWFYLGLNEIMDGPNSFTFEFSLEKKLSEAAARGKQSIFRVYLDFPNKKHAVPQFLIDGGHQLIPYKNDDPDNKGGLSPDYTDEKLIQAIENSIKAMGKKYDGDPRIGFITVGYLGHWGEWHTYPNTHLMAQKTVQTRTLKAFYDSFKITKFLLRYPDHYQAKMPSGLHDDSFAFATLTSKDKSWHFLSRSKKFGTLGLWKTQPIGGEIYPPLQKLIWDSKKPKNTEDYLTCVKQTHCSWLINNAIFNGKWDTRKKARAMTGSKALGYEFYVEAFSIKDGKLKIRITNKGVAPFYYKWPIEIVNIDSKKVYKTNWDIRKVLPESTIEFQAKVPGKNLGIRILNPMKNGKAITFANETMNGEILILK